MIPTRLVALGFKLFNQYVDNCFCWGFHFYIPECCCFLVVVVVVFVVVVVVVVASGVFSLGFICNALVQASGLQTTN